MRYSHNPDNFNEKRKPKVRVTDLRELLRVRSSWWLDIQEHNDTIIKELKRVFDQSDMFMEIKDIVMEMVCSHSWEAGMYYSNCINVIFEPIDRVVPKRVASHVQTMLFTTKIPFKGVTFPSANVRFG